MLRTNKATNRKRKIPCDSEPSDPFEFTSAQTASVAYWLYLTDDSLSIREVARRLEMPYSSVQYLIKKAETFGAATLLQRRAAEVLPPHMTKKLSPADISFIEQSVHRDPHIFLDELRADVLEFRGVDVSESTLCRVLNVSFVSSVYLTCSRTRSNSP
jgi:transposase